MHGITDLTIPSLKRVDASNVTLHCTAFLTLPSMFCECKHLQHIMHGITDLTIPILKGVDTSTVTLHCIPCIYFYCNYKSYARIF